MGHPQAFFGIKARPPASWSCFSSVGQSLGGRPWRTICQPCPTAMTRNLNMCFTSEEFRRNVLPIHTRADSQLSLRLFLRGNESELVFCFFPRQVEDPRDE